MAKFVDINGTTYNADFIKFVVVVREIANHAGVRVWFHSMNRDSIFIDCDSIDEAHAMKREIDRQLVEPPKFVRIGDYIFARDRIVSVECDHEHKCLSIVVGSMGYNIETDNLEAEYEKIINAIL